MLTDTDTNVLEALDFDFVQPCEHSKHAAQHRHDDPAMFFVEIVHPDCCLVGFQYFICLSGWENLGRQTYLRCRHCGYNLGHRDGALKILRVIGT